MKISTLIIEDEIAASKHLIGILEKLPMSFEVLAVLSSIETSKEWLQKNESPELIFMDIHLSDGSSFEILEDIVVSCPIIYTTAYDQYAIKAFKTTGIDYLLKPITLDDVALALTKFEGANEKTKEDRFLENIDLLNQINFNKSITYQEHFLFKNGTSFIPINTDQIAYFYREELVFAKLFDGRSFVVDESLEQIQSLLNPIHFIRLQRKLLAQVSAIAELKIYKPGKFSVSLNPPFPDSILLSQERSSWLRKFFKA